jgi:hypothetical protein
VDGSLFAGTLPKRLPAFFRPDPMIGGSDESGIFQNLLFATKYTTTMADKLDPVPYTYIVRDTLDRH